MPTGHKKKSPSATVWRRAYSGLSREHSKERSVDMYERKLGGTSNESLSNDVQSHTAKICLEVVRQSVCAMERAMGRAASSLPEKLRCSRF